MIYKFYNEEVDDFQTEFFLPDKNLKYLKKRLDTIRQYKSRGYQTAGILYVNYETYLNGRLSKNVGEYLHMEDEEKTLNDNYVQGIVSYAVYMESLECIKEYKEVLLKLINKGVNRLKNNNFRVTNLTALNLQKKYKDMLSKL